jgi:hypothetical protein
LTPLPLPLSLPLPQPLPLPLPRESQGSQSRRSAESRNASMQRTAGRTKSSRIRMWGGKKLEKIFNFLRKKKKNSKKNSQLDPCRDKKTDTFRPIIYIHCRLLNFVDFAVNFLLICADLC